MKRGAKQHRSSDGVPNRKGGSWPNHPSMRYELPIPFSPGADNVTDDYRSGWDRIFGKSDAAQREHDAGLCGTTCQFDHTPPAFDEWGYPAGMFEKRAFLGQPLEVPIVLPWPPCDACGEQSNHYVEPGVFTCEIES